MGGRRPSSILCFRFRQRDLDLQLVTASVVSSDCPSRVQYRFILRLEVRACEIDVRLMD